MLAFPRRTLIDRNTLLLVLTRCFRSEDYLPQLKKKIHCTVHYGCERLRNPLNEIPAISTPLTGVFLSMYPGTSLLWKLTTKVHVTCTPLIGGVLADANTVDKILGLKTFLRFYTMLKEQLPAIIAGSPALADGRDDSAAAPLDGIMQQYELCSLP